MSLPSPVNFHATICHSNFLCVSKLHKIKFPYFSQNCLFITITSWMTSKTENRTAQICSKNTYIMWHTVFCTSYICELETLHCSTQPAANVANYRPMVKLGFNHWCLHQNSKSCHINTVVVVGVNFINRHRTYCESENNWKQMQRK